MSLDLVYSFTCNYRVSTYLSALKYNIGLQEAALAKKEAMV